MLKDLDTLKQMLQDCTGSAQKPELAELLGRIEKNYLINEFKLQRLTKDKAIMEKLLNASIEDLQQKQQTIEENNAVLKQQKREIEIKNLELSYQKQVVEAQASQLQTNFVKLEQSYNELEQFSYIASHDLKSPLRTIANFAQLLKKRYSGQLDQQADEFINFIVSGANNMSNVISDLLEYSRVGLKEKDFALTNLNTILELVQFNLSDAIHKSQATIVVQELPTIMANKQGMMQVFQNLIGNAIKFRSEQPPVIQISCTQEADQWLFSVSDNGVGMNEKHQEKAFMPFQRLNNNERPGTGMGLAICKKVINLHQGQIHYKSTPGEGTTFYFELEACTTAACEVEAPQGVLTVTES